MGMVGSELELGLGTIGLGRPWGKPDTGVPTADQVDRLLAHAVSRGVRVLDTAPAYGTSEERLGSFLRTVAPEARERLFVCTKVGENWTPSGGSVVDHSLDECRRSLDRSVDRLGRIDLLQIHKCSVDVLSDDAFVGWLVGLRDACVVGAIGASVADVETFRYAMELEVFDAIQMPGNPNRPEFAEPAGQLARPGRRSVVPLLNRPFGSGAIEPGVQAFSWLRAQYGRGVVLSGTTSTRHLDQNLRWIQGRS
jgi:aryl-alcohol dehydrogenase-like predicted oxidoreductase